MEITYSYGFLRKWLLRIPRECSLRQFPRDVEPSPFVTLLPELRRRPRGNIGVFLVA
jgi:hypothetical protein